MNLKFRPLRADEVECRVSQIFQRDGAPSGLSLLLYKDARCDMNVLDETVGPLAWQRSHSRENANCTISIWDAEKSQWVSKEDTGTESNTEAAKGLASDSFKRAGFNWGIGRELYTAPRIFIGADKCSIKPTGKTDRGGKPVFACYDSFEVSSMEVQDGRIVQLTISLNRKEVFKFGEPSTAPCAACGKPVRAAIAQRSMAANGAVYCSGTCKKAAEQAAAAMENGGRMEF